MLVVVKLFLCIYMLEVDDGIIWYDIVLFMIIVYNFYFLVVVGIFDVWEGCYGLLFVVRVVGYVM